MARAIEYGDLVPRTAQIVEEWRHRALHQQEHARWRSMKSHDKLASLMSEDSNRLTAWLRGWEALRRAGVAAWRISRRTSSPVILRASATTARASRG